MDRSYRKKHGSKELEIEPAEKDEMGREKPLGAKAGSAYPASTFLPGADPIKQARVDQKFSGLKANLELGGDLR
jgi:hypothetical protein